MLEFLEYFASVIMIERLNLNAFKFFYFVAQCGSITQAAEILCVTQGAVSKQIQALEQRLNLTLFLRSHKKMTLTMEGQQLYSTCQQIFELLDQRLIQLQQTPLQAMPLAVSCEPTLAMKWLIPRLADFQQRYPSIEISLLTAGGAVDWQKHPIDLALRRDDFEFSPHLYAEKIAAEYMLCVSKPDASASARTRLQASQFFVSSTTTQPDQTVFVSSSRPSIWQDFNQQLSNRNLAIQLKPKSLQHFYLCLESSLAGLGASIASIYMLEKELQHHMLQARCPIYADQSSYYLLSALPFEQDPRKICFKNWLIEQMQLTAHYILNTFQVKS